MTSAKKCSHCTTSFKDKCLLKSDKVFSFFGDLDELNVVLGLAKTFTVSRKLKKSLVRIQSDLIQLGGLLATGNKDDFLTSRIPSLERQIANLKDPKTRKFVLPGKNKTSAFLHLARVITRRVERKAVGLLEKNKIKLPAKTQALLVQYLNCLSTYLFWLAVKEGTKQITKKMLKIRLKRRQE